MKTRILLLVTVLFLLSSFVQPNGWPQSATLSPLPVAPVRPVVDDYFGTKVADPYRYMENISDPEVQAWTKAQNDYARAVLARVAGRSKIRQRIRELDQSAPAFVSDLRHVPGDIYFYLKLSVGADIAKLYIRHGLDGEEMVVLDPDTIKL